MGLAVCSGAQMMCTFGAAPSVLNILPVNRVMGSTPVAGMMDNVPFLNISPFGMCSSPSNPMVAAATAAALGVLTPMPCIPATVAPWVGSPPTVVLGTFPILNNSSKLNCMWGGVISIINPAIYTVAVP
jgi:hypothetical protein